MTERFPAIPPDQMTEAQREVAAAIAGGPRGSVRGPFLALLHHPALAMRIQALGEHLRFGTGMPQSLVELLILVTARRWNCQYEFFAHARIARNEGLPEPIITAIAEGRRPDPMNADQAMVHDFAVATHRDGKPTDALYAAAEARFGKAGVLDLLALAGYYTMLAMVLNTADPALPDGATPPLKPL
ncbi:carboxymuconolactone decarboxylase family protein [Roseomonas frigidaquae]|uniref:Carboxymuconolactone decarboxylase family protein n=1 Tax=Falsiroseomonas frigidaquae TaxID=487318 RepID=A0ABX1ETU3_9PROT|nr:carboxymuconolactone decarboxylase family protein [Falsiroseomonas frigidaquae]NKE43329.1 carboxymuconolactone decarboxylase family protein [Falsiroseomonas frigidaquae]